MSRYRDVELSSFGNVQLMLHCRDVHVRRDVRRDVEMKRFRVVEMSSCLVSFGEMCRFGKICRAGRTL